MLVYIILEFIIFFFGFLAQSNNLRTYSETVVEEDGTVRLKNNYSIFYPIIYLSLLFVTGFRYYIGSDYGAYINDIYLKEEVIEKIVSFNEPVLASLTFLSRHIIDDGCFVIFVISFIAITLTFRGFKRYDQNDIMMLTLLYVTIGSWVFFMCGERQGLAIAFIFAFINPYSKKRMILKYAVVCIIAFLIHKSALLMLPILLLSKRKIDFYQIVFIIVFSVVLAFFYENLFGFMDIDLNKLGEVETEFYYRDINPLRVAVSAAPALLILFVDDKEKFFNENGMLVNLTLFNTAMTLSTYHSAYANRFTQYTTIFVIAFIVKALKAANYRNRRLMSIITVVLYSAFWYYEIYNASFLSPFKWSFSHFGEY